MVTSTSGLDLIGLVILGGGAALLGLALLLVKPTSAQRRRIALGLAILLPALLATWSLLIDESVGAHWPLLLAGASVACLLLSPTYPRRLLAAVACVADRPRVQGATLMVVGLGLLFGVPWWHEQEAARAVQTRPDYLDDPVYVLRHQRQVTAWTDRGAPLTVFDLGGHLALVDDGVAEADMARSRGLGLHLIRTAPPDAGSNCHGWVFTGGRYLVDGGDVDRILQDNGYDAVEAPRVGDLVIYRIRGGIVAHSAVVRMATDDGLVLVESKWNTLGRYLHAPNAYSPDATWAYFRSARAGHLLRGLDSAASSPGANPVAEHAIPET